MEEYQIIRCSFESYCKKCSWIYINHPRISRITRITDNCLTTQNFISKEVHVFYNDNRSTSRYHGERCCYGERTIFFVPGIHRVTVKCETKSKWNETKSIETKRKPTETKPTDTKHTETKRNLTKQLYLYWYVNFLYWTIKPN
jgi:hypothetical protein